MVIFGLSIEVYFILLILGTPFYFLFRWIFKKRVADKTRRIIYTWISALIAAPVFYVLLVVAFVFSESYYPNRDFDKKAWQTNTDTRYEYSKDIINNKILIGKTKAEVKTLLGDWGGPFNYNDWCYELGYVPEIGNIDPDYMCITFKNGRVTNVEQHQS